MHLAVAIDLYDEARRQGVDDGCANTVKAAGNGVGLAAELTSGVQGGHYGFDG